MLMVILILIFSSTTRVVHIYQKKTLKIVRIFYFINFDLLILLDVILILKMIKSYKIYTRSLYLSLSHNHLVHPSTT